MPATDTPPSLALPPPTGYPRLPFGIFLGLRYLKPQRTYLSVITIICVIGVALGIAVPIIVISVMAGYETELKAKVLGFDPHIQVTTDSLVSDWRTLRKEVEGTPGVVAAAPYVQGPVLAEFNNKRLAPMVRGIEPSLEARVIDLKALMGKDDPARGKFDLDGDKAVVGVDFARLIGLHVGDKLTLYSPHNLEALTGELNKLSGKAASQEQIAQLQSMVTPVTLEVTGIFDSGRYQYDSNFVLVPLHIGQELYEFGGRVHGLSVKTTDAYRAEETKLALKNKFIEQESTRPLPPEPVAPPAPGESPGPGASPAIGASPGPEALFPPPEDEPPPDDLPHAQTWMELNSQFFDAVRTEKSVMFVIFAVVSVVAGFCVTVTLITITVQKTREIGIMNAVGADTWQIVRVFASQGIVVGIFGMVVGLVIARCFLVALNPFKQMMERLFHFDVFAKQVYGFGAIPYQMRPGDVILICAGAFIICSLAALIPAYLAARLDPVKALRSE